MKIILTILCFATALTITQAAMCHGQPGEIHNNTLPIWNKEPEFVRQVENGKLYIMGDPIFNNTMYLMHVYGTAEEMGKAQGDLLGNELKDFMDELYEYIEEQVIEAIPDWVPLFVRKGIAKVGVALALDLTYWITNPYTTQDYYVEVKALSKACGASYKQARRIHLIGELTKGACSMFGAWGKATENAGTMQLRALDWDFDGPYRKKPSVTIYHPTKGKGNTWANIGFIGWAGVLSGVSDQKMAISEIGVTFPDDTFGKESRIGNPFTFLLRDILQFDTSLEQSIERLTKNTRRTCNLILGVGDGKPETASFRGFEYSHTVCNVISDTNLAPVNDTWHPKIENVVYWGMDWLCPPYHKRFHEMLMQYHGHINYENAIRSILPSLTSGNLQAVVYDLTNENTYVAFGYRNEDGSFKVNAYDKAYVKLDLKKLFAEPKPEI